MRTRRGGLLWWSVMVALCVAVAYGIVQVRHVADELNGARSDRDALAQQVRDLGGTPTVGPKGRDGSDGEQGAKGEPGNAGRDGRDGPDGAAGPSGVPGKPGSAGADGADGADGVPGAAGEQGPQGEPGAKGEQGAKGDPGEAGESVMCLPGYTPHDVVWLAETYSLCRKDAEQ